VIESNHDLVAEELDELDRWRGAFMKSKLEGTYLGRQVQTHEPQGGQYQLDGEPTITGTEPLAKVPMLPPTSPWASDPVGPERPTGRAIDAVPDMERVHED
jgi:hypothetical protein